MNKKKILAVADYIEKSKTFDQKYSTYDGNPNDIIDHTLKLNGFRYRKRTDAWVDKDGNPVSDDWDKASEILGLSGYEPSDLLASYPIPGKTLITREHAAKVLRNFVKTGEVNWLN